MYADDIPTELHTPFQHLTTSRHTQVRSGLRGDRHPAAAAGGARHAAGRGLRAPDRVPVPAARSPAGVCETLVTGWRPRQVSTMLRPHLHRGPVL